MDTFGRPRTLVLPSHWDRRILRSLYI